MGKLRVKISHLFSSCLTLISPVLNTKVMFRRRLGRKLDLAHPQTLNEKVMWLKLHNYNTNPLVVQCADKYAVREYVQQCGCAEILNELYGVYDRVEDIDFDKLPQQFVLKLNAGCGMNLLCEDKSLLSIPHVKRQLKRWMRSKQHLRYSEMHYARIPKKIICEKYLQMPGRVVPDDFKVYCCYGQPHYVMVCVGRENRRPKFYYFDTQGNFHREMTIEGREAPMDFHYELPETWNDMLRYAALLSRPFPFVRVDFYCVQGKVVFGELTFTPAAGLDVEHLPSTDKMLGDLIDLSK